MRGRARFKSKLAENFVLRVCRELVELWVVGTEVGDVSAKFFVCCETGVVGLGAGGDGVGQFGEVVGVVVSEVLFGGGGGSGGRFRFGGIGGAR